MLDEVRYDRPHRLGKASEEADGDREDEDIDGSERGNAIADTPC